jgi:hypothetical protein
MVNLSKHHDSNKNSGVVLIAFPIVLPINNNPIVKERMIPSIILP